MFKKLLLLLTFFSVASLQGTDLLQTVIDVAGPLPCKQITKLDCKHTPLWLTVTPDGTKLVTSYYLGWGAWVNQLDVLNLQGKKLAQYGQGGWTKGTFRLCITNDSKKIVYAYSGIHIWDMHGNELAQWDYDGHLSTLHLIDDTILLGCDDGTVYAWDMHGNLLTTCKGHRDAITAIELLPDGKLVTCSRDRTLRVWDKEGNECALYESTWHSITLVGVTQASHKATPDAAEDNKIIAAYSDKTLRVWDVKGKQITGWDADIKRNAESFYLSEDNKIVAACSGGIIRMWDIEGNQLAEWQAHERGVRALQATSDNRRIVSCARGAIRVWDMEGNQLAECSSVPEESIYSVQVTQDDAKIVTDVQKTIYVWDLSLLHALEHVDEEKAQKITDYLEEIKNKKHINKKKIWRFVNNTINDSSWWW